LKGYTDNGEVIYAISQPTNPLQRGMLQL